jgi:hypothetical protein
MSDPLVQNGELDQSAIARWAKRAWKAEALSAELLAAAVKLEEAEIFHANCEECDGLGVPELCGECFPLFDDARCMRRAAIAKAEGR